MTGHLSEQIIDKLTYAKELYHRLILVVGSRSQGKTIALQEVAKRMDIPFLNINLELSRTLLELTERQRILQVQHFLGEVVARPDCDVILLDNIEILFDVALKQDPLRLLQGLSRNRTLVAAWSGSIEDNHLTYAAPDHPEYRRYPVGDFLVVTAAAHGQPGFGAV
jgi:hypothetical protein